MSVESATYINTLDSTLPAAADGMGEGDNHLRLIKAVLKATFPNVTGAVTATQASLNTGVPIGTILLWYSTAGSVPSGYAVCDGSTVARSDGGGNITTPDLRNRFVVGAGTTYTQGTTGGAASVTSGAGGAHTPAGTLSTAAGHTHGGATGSHVLTESEIPAHGHPFRYVGSTSGAGTEAIVLNAGGSQSNATAFTGTPDTTAGHQIGGTGGGQGHTHTISSDGSHTHTFTGTAVADHTHTVATLPPYAALVYIMRV